jgi:hypothetical protein
LFALAFTELAVGVFGKGALRAESETQSGSGCVLSDLALFFLKIF